MSDRRSAGESPAYGAATLNPGIRSRFIEGVNGLTVHVLESGWEDGERPALLLLHGFPELAYSWRKLMRPLADAGYYVVASDQRGYGRTTGWDAGYDGDLASVGMINLVRDTMALVAALGRDSLAAVIGHDFGSPVAAYAALIRPDIFRSAVMMSGPFGGPPRLGAEGRAAGGIHEQLAALQRPRKHYQAYYCTREADADMRNAPQGVHDFLRAYYHMKSADWKANQPHPLEARTAAELAQLPNYYVMDLAADMPATVAPEMPADAEIAACAWLPDEELRVYSDEFRRNGFQGGLQWYRAFSAGRTFAELQLFAGRTIDVPSAFIAGKSDWGVYQTAGAYERMQSEACTRMLGCDLVEGAGHWVQQEQPAAVTGLLLDFLTEAAPA